MEYAVYFRVYNKKMKVVIETDNENNIKSIIQNNIIIDKIEENGDVMQIFDNFKKPNDNDLKNLFGIKD